jgi:plastocyanin
MNQLVQGLLDFLSPIVIPDWGALISLIPIGLALLVIAWFALTIRRFATAGPTRRAPARVSPIAPPHVHMPGGSAAPIVVAMGAFLLFFGLVVGGPVLPIGLALLVVTLLVWGREAIRDYDHVEPARLLPAVIHEGPPPGVHMPGPSIRPFLGALGTAALLGGLVIGGPILLVAVIFLVWTLLGWLWDASAEYRKVEEADRTGHLENPPAHGLPAAALQLFIAIFLVVGIFQGGVLNAIGGGGGNGAPAPGSSPAAAASGGPALPPGTLAVNAKDVAFDVKDLSTKAGAPFSIAFKNEDPAGVPHNVELRAADGTTVVQDQATIDGGKSIVYQFNPLQPGTYVFICKVHPIPQMTGKLTVQ